MVIAIGHGVFAEQHHRDTVDPAADLVRRHGQRGEDDAVDGMAAHPIKQALLHGWVGAGDLDKQHVAQSGGRLGEPGRQLGEVRGLQLRHRQREEASAPGLQLSGTEVWSVSELTNRRLHPGPGRGADVRIVVDHIGGSLHADPCQLSDVFEASHHASTSARAWVEWSRISSPAWTSRFDSSDVQPQVNVVRSPGATLVSVVNVPVGVASTTSERAQFPYPARLNPPQRHNPRSLKEHHDNDVQLFPRRARFHRQQYLSTTTSWRCARRRGCGRSGRLLARIGRCTWSGGFGCRGWGC